jgi:hypothetical protein
VNGVRVDLQLRYEFTINGIFYRLKAKNIKRNLIKISIR